MGLMLWLAMLIGVVLLFAGMLAHSVWMVLPGAILVVVFGMILRFRHGPTGLDNRASVLSADEMDDGDGD